MVGQASGQAGGQVGGRQTLGFLRQLEFPFHQSTSNFAGG